MRSLAVLVSVPGDVAPRGSGPDLEQPGHSPRRTEPRRQWSPPASPRWKRGSGQVELDRLAVFFELGVLDEESVLAELALALLDALDGFGSGHLAWVVRQLEEGALGVGKGAAGPLGERGDGGGELGAEVVEPVETGEEALGVDADDAVQRGGAVFVSEIAVDVLPLKVVAVIADG